MLELETLAQHPAKITVAREKAALKRAYLLVANTAPIPHLYRQQQNLLRELHSILYNKICR